MTVLSREFVGSLIHNYTHQEIISIFTPKQQVMSQYGCPLFWDACDGSAGCLFLHHIDVLISCQDSNKVVVSPSDTCSSTVLSRYKGTQLINSANVGGNRFKHSLKPLTEINFSWFMQVHIIHFLVRYRRRLNAPTAGAFNTQPEALPTGGRADNLSPARIARITHVVWMQGCCAVWKEA